jgi:hypothetical protein
VTAERTTSIEVRTSAALRSAYIEYERNSTFIMLFPDWAGVTPRTFWAARSRKSGVAPAQFGECAAVTFESGPPYLLVSEFNSSVKGEDLGADNSTERNSYLRHRHARKQIVFGEL